MVKHNLKVKYKARFLGNGMKTGLSKHTQNSMLMYCRDQGQTLKQFLVMNLPNTIIPFLVMFGVGITILKVLLPS